MTYQQIIQEIYCFQKPIAFSYKKYKNFSIIPYLHAMIIYGYDARDITQLILKIYDPGTGQDITMTYDEYLANSMYSWYHILDH